MGVLTGVSGCLITGVLTVGASCAINGCLITGSVVNTHLTGTVGSGNNNFGLAPANNLTANLNC